MRFKNLIPWRKRRECQSVRSDDYNSLEKFQRRMENLFDDFTSLMDISPANLFGSDKFDIAVDMKDTEKSLEIIAELPGMDEDNIDISISDGVLTIKGEKKSEDIDENKDEGYYHSERYFGSFQRSFALPCEIEIDKSNAVFDKGVLKISLPKIKTKEEVVKKIKINNS